MLRHVDVSVELQHVFHHCGEAIVHNPAATVKLGGLGAIACGIEQCAGVSSNRAVPAPIGCLLPPPGERAIQSGVVDRQPIE